MIAINRADEVLDIKKNPANLLSVCANTGKRNLILRVDYLTQDKAHLSIDHSPVMKYSTKAKWKTQNPGRNVACDDKETIGQLFYRGIVLK